MESNSEDIKKAIRDAYSRVAAQQSGERCCSSGCCCSGLTQDISAKLGYSKENLSEIPDEANMGLGCGNPVAIAGIKKGETVLDLGCGGGLDCFLASRQTGETGRVIGVDMTPDMISLARKNAEGRYTNVEFRLGEIEHLPVADLSVDVVISNCVINLSVNKEQVFKEVYRVLKPGGRLSISDVVAVAPIPQNLKEDFNLISSCIGGAEHVDNITTMLVNAGFENIRLSPKENSKEIIASWNLGEKTGDMVASYIIEATK